MMDFRELIQYMKWKSDKTVKGIEAKVEKY
jgi:hypothetical protein